MKKLMFMALLLLGLGSCQKDPIAPSGVDSESPSITMIPAQDSVASTPQLKAAGRVEYAVSPRFGKPNTTTYVFKVYDPSGTLALSVKLYDKATGSITYLSMPRIGSYWKLSTTLSNNGWFEYRYVYSANKSNISNTTYQPLCNSRNTFSSSGISSISWPFGADGSSWNNRTVTVNGMSQTWRGGEETKGTAYHYGYGWNEGTHTGYDECYSDDWNRGTGSQDIGAIIRSPLDGYIQNFGTYTTSLGQSKYVAIIQESSNGKLYRFYVGHLQSYPSTLYIGKYMRAGIDLIGNLGMSGASSPHAHCNMRNFTNGGNNSVAFYFNAQ